jgi:hypothetical protein
MGTNDLLPALRSATDGVSFFGTSKARDDILTFSLTYMTQWETHSAPPS